MACERVLAGDKARASLDVLTMRRLNVRLSPLSQADVAPLRLDWHAAKVRFRPVRILGVRPNADSSRE